MTRQLLSGSYPHHNSSQSFSPARRREVNQVLKLSNLFASLPRREEGQTMAEYGVVLAVITLGVVVALGFLSGAISDAIDSVISFL